MRNKICILGIVVFAGLLAVSAQQGSPTLKKIKEYDLPGPAGKRFDYLTIDDADGYPFGQNFHPCIHAASRS